MKAVFFEKHGGAEVLKYGNFRDPSSLDANDCLVGVRACSLNHLDIWVREGYPGISVPMPHILGSDVCGVVLETGKSVKRFRKGERVLVSPGQLPSHHLEAREARDSFSPEFQILGLQKQGGYAEKVAVHDEYLVPVSDKYSFEEWASLPLVSLTAYHTLATRGGLKPGETVLIHSAGSGVGSAAIQIAKAFGATVFTTVGEPKKATHAKKLGADEVILYKTKDFAEAVKKFTNGRGVDVVLDHIGPATWHKNISSLARGGRMVTYGATSGPKAEVDIRYVYSKQVSIIGCYMGSFAELLKVLELAEKGILKPTLDQIFPLKDAAAAHRRMESRQNFGKIVLKVSS